MTLKIQHCNHRNASKMYNILKIVILKCNYIILFLIIKCFTVFFYQINAALVITSIN